MPLHNRKSFRNLMILSFIWASKVRDSRKA
jgi:hypothetical protein